MSQLCASSRSGRTPAEATGEEQGVEVRVVAVLVDAVVGDLRGPRMHGRVQVVPAFDPC
jgi:hypothetical protein